MLDALSHFTCEIKCATFYTFLAHFLSKKESWEEGDLQRVLDIIYYFNHTQL